MKKLLLASVALLFAGTSRATLPEWLAGGADASAIVHEARGKAAADAAVVPAPPGAARISAGEGGHLLDLARRVIERGDVTLTGKVGASDKYDAYACENASTHQIAAAAHPQTCAKIFPSSPVLVVALEVLADLHADGSRSIKGVKIFSGRATASHKTPDMQSDDGLWIRGGRVAEYSRAQQLTAEQQSRIKENLDVWDRMTPGMMELDDSCYDESGGTCG